MKIATKKRDVIRALDALASEHDGVLTPEQVIQEAKNRNNPLHQEFEWTESRAAHLYRLTQARRLLRTYLVVKVGGGKTTGGVRRFYNIVTEIGERKKYVRAKDVFKDKEWTVRAAVEVFNQFKRQVKPLEAFPQYFSDLLEAINVEVAKISFSQKKKGMTG